MKLGRDFFEDLLRDAQGGAGGAAATAGQQQQGAAGGAASAQGQQGAASGSAGSAAAGDQGQQGQQGGQQAAGFHSAPYYPEGLADPFRGTNDRETIDRLSKAVRAAPAKPDDYQVELAPELAKHFKDLGNDPMLKAYRGVAHKHGLDSKQFNGVFGDLVGEMAKQGLFVPLIDDRAENAKLAQGEVDPTRASAKVMQRRGAADSFIKAQTDRGVFTKDEGEALSALTAVAAGVTLIEKLAGRFGEASLNPGGQGGNAQPTKDQLQRDMQDPRYSSTSPQYDPAFRQRVDASWKNLR